MNKKGDMISIIAVLFPVLLLFIVLILASYFSVQEANVHNQLDKICPSKMNNEYISKTHVNCYIGDEIILENGVYVKKPIYIGMKLEEGDWEK